MVFGNILLFVYEFCERGGTRYSQGFTEFHVKVDRQIIAMRVAEVTIMIMSVNMSEGRDGSTYHFIEYVLQVLNVISHLFLKTLRYRNCNECKLVGRHTHLKFILN